MRVEAFLLFSILALKSDLVENANILVLWPLPGPSHFMGFKGLFEALAERGHDVDVVSNFPQKKPISRYHDLSIKGNLPNLQNNLSMQVIESKASFSDFLSFMVVDCGYMVCSEAFKHPVVQQLRNSTKKYDLVITEIFGSDCMLGFAHLFKAPVVSLTSSVALPWENDRFGNPDHPAYIPTYFTMSTDRMSLWQRIENVLTMVHAKLAYRTWSTIPSNTLMKEFFGPEIPDLDELVLNTSLVLVNSHFSINTPRPTVPNFIEIGGMHIKTPKPLPDYLEKVLADSEYDIVFLTMGSMIRSETFTPDKLQGMFDAFGELPYTILWKAEIENFPKGLRIPKNIHFESWMPQLDILCHPKVKLFISHGGLLGTQEAIYCGTPVMGIPLFADQVLNIRQMEEEGLATKVNYQDISKDTVLNAARKILNNFRYKENAMRLSRLFKDRPNTPMDTAIFWIEYVIRHKGAPHLKSAAVRLTWYQYYFIDAAVVVLLAFLIVMYIARKILIFFLGSRMKEKIN